MAASANERDGVRRIAITGIGSINALGRNVA
jgi:hypothetical protein